MQTSKLTGIALSAAISILVITGCSSGPSGIPQAKAGTLLRAIQDRGRLVVGVKYDTPGFGYLNPQTNKVEGFDPAVAREVAAYIFGDPSKVEFKQAVTKDRETNLQNGTFDLVLATMIITEERAKLVDFSIVYYQSGPRLLVAKDSPIKSITDVDGKKVGLSTNSAYIPVLAKMTKAIPVQFDTPGALAEQLLKQNIDAVTANDITLYGLALANPGLKIVGAQFSQEFFGAGIAKGNPEVLDVVNSVITNLKTSGKWKTIWKTEIGDKYGIATVPEPPSDNWK
jgi:aspartate/glutamate/glutamine transport system substrate-binding protein